MKFGFKILWTGQLISVAGSAITAFLVSFWIHRETGSALTVPMSLFLKFAPQIYFSLFAGQLIDAWDRRRLLLITNLALTLVAILMAILLGQAHPSLPLFYGLLFISGLLDGVQSLALQALPSLFLQKDDLMRASGVLLTVENLSKALGPCVAALLMEVGPISTILWIDALTFLIAALAVRHTDFPSEVREVRRLPMAKKFGDGLTFLREHFDLRQLQTLYTLVNFATGILAGLLVPLILRRTGNSEGMLAVVITAGAIGGIAGGIFVTTLANRLKHAELAVGSMVLGGLVGRIGLALGGSLPLWALAHFARSFTIPVTTAAGNPTWQTKVPQAMQGRVFGARRLLSQGAYPLALLLGGLLGEYIFTDSLAHSFGLGALLGDTPGSGLALLFALVGIFEVAVALSYWKSGRLRFMNE